ncbi:3'-5' exonuclease [Maritimibacter dapengensis]|uniref:DNA 3'-5' helicase n=1 Tax=Maritimibacter dapengensis TaxID=2836868 RepID=A0ABS6T5U4_9RHOB|nr:3'-5' exonuclease [Maritimibacter dapengensis]MBV7380584.1 AAA family ATPase [Maritimibacter dapengensis]
MTHRIADTFYDALAKLSPQEQKQVKQSAFDFQMDPSLPGFSTHRVDRARDPDFWTARVNRDIRMVIHKKDGDTLLAWVGHHDDAYRWAETRRIEAHPKTGVVQIVEARESVEDIVVQRYVEEAVRMPRLFADEHDETLLSWGVPEDWLDTVRDATEDTILDIAHRLPGEAADALLAAATGSRPAPAPIVADDQDPWQHPDTLRRFRVVDNVEELREALDAPWEKWSVFLHPAQREFVDRDFNGPARVIGSAGTGKTVVALHRAARLAKDPDARVLLTTFNRRLARALNEKVPLVANGDTRKRIHVEALGPLVGRLHAERFGDSELVDEETLRTLLADAAQDQGLSADPEFLFDEWSLIVDAWAVPDQETYRDLPRLGRKLRMAASRRDALWAVFAQVRQELISKGLKTETQLAHELREVGEIPFTHALVDEAQDISVAELLLLGSTLGNQLNGLFFAGDIGQRIFRAPFPWSAAKVDVRGRSRSLKVNYRTSHQIRLRSDLLLPETLVEADGSEEARLGVTSVFDGPAPELRAFADRSDEIREVATWVEAIADQGVSSDEIAILVRQDAMIAQLPEGLANHATIMPMHDAKGAEFRAVAIPFLDQDVLPDETRLLAARDEGQLDEVMNTERHLLYVAATRARDFLWMSGTEPLSDFLSDLIQARKAE